MGETAALMVPPFAIMAFSRGVAQLGQRGWFGASRPGVRIFPPRPWNGPDYRAGRGSIGRAAVFHAAGCEFESRRPVHFSGNVVSMAERRFPKPDAWF